MIKERLPSVPSDYEDRLTTIMLPQPSKPLSISFSTFRMWDWIVLLASRVEESIVELWVSDFLLLTIPRIMSFSVMKGVFADTNTR